MTGWTSLQVRYGGAVARPELRAQGIGSVSRGVLYRVFSPSRSGGPLPETGPAVGPRSIRRGVHSVPAWGRAFAASSARAAWARSPAVFAWPATPQPPSGDSVRSTHVRWSRLGSPAAAATISVSSLTTP